jgi:hypothetical protein
MGKVGLDKKDFKNQDFPGNLRSPAEADGGTWHCDRDTLTECT